MYVILISLLCTIYSIISTYMYDALCYMYMFQDPVNSSEKLTVYCNEILHGEGYKFWFDKSVSVLIYKNGVVSYIFINLLLTYYY